MKAGKAPLVEKLMFRFRNKTDDATRKVLGQKPVAPPRTIRRAIGLVPDTHQKAMHEIRDTIALRFHHLLVSLEGSEKTGCLKITSPARHSRSAILLYRGRVVGCIYGQKNMRGQYLAEDAHKCALSDLAAPGNLLDAYELPEEIVLASASLFYGETLDVSFAPNASQAFDHAVNSLLRCGLPGTVIINNEDNQTVCIAYIASSKVVGLFSAHEGWLKATPQEARRMMQAQPCRIHASILTVRDAYALGFSLTGLGDRAPKEIEPTNIFADRNSGRRTQRQAAPTQEQVRPQVVAAQVQHPTQDFSPPKQDAVARRRTSSQEAVAQAVRAESMARRTGQHHVGSRSKAMARV